MKYINNLFKICVILGFLISQNEEVEGQREAERQHFEGGPPWTQRGGCTGME